MKSDQSIRQEFHNPDVLSKFTSANGRSFGLVPASDFSANDYPYHGVTLIPVTGEAA